MRHVELKSYCFNRPHQWRAGVPDQLEVSDKGLAAPAQMRLVPLTGTHPEDNTQALAFDPCGELHWVRDRTFELIRALRDGTLVVGYLRIDRRAEDWRPADLALGTHHLWLLTRSRRGDEPPRILRYIASSHQRLAGIELDRTVLALCTDRKDGAWIILGGDTENAELVHFDPTGDRLATITLSVPLTTAAVNVTSAGDNLVVLDAEPQDDRCDTPLLWRLWIVDIRACKPEPRLIFSLPARDRACRRDFPDFRANRLAVDCAGRIHLMASGSSELWTLSLKGEVTAQHPGTAPTTWLPLNALAASEDLAATGGGGVAWLRQTQDALPNSIATYITPALISPDGVQRGWMRADLDAELEQGAAVEVSVAATRESSLVDAVAELFAHKALPPSTRLRQIDARLPWIEERTKIYRGGESPSGSPLRYPLHEIDATHIWIRIRIHAMPGTSVPRIKSLRVLYPNISYARYLPAVYQEDKTAAKFLRRLLVIFESVFGDLDTELAELPRRIDPRTAPDDWLPFLLRWLGLPAPTELEPGTRRLLLACTPELLRNRGTMAALENLLSIVVGKDFSVTDSGAGPAPWTLPPRHRAVSGPRLGCDTLVLVQRQPGFRLGCSAQLGKQALGHTALDPLHLFARRSGAILIRVAADTARRKKLEPLLQRYLPYFIPAHCRYRLRFVQQGGLQRAPVLDSELRLHAESLPRLGDARVGGLPLPVTKSEGIILGRSTFVDDGLYLS